MAQPNINIEQPEQERNRTELSLGQIGERWNYQPRGPDFSRSLLSFLQRLDSENTLKMYAFTLLEFFNWYWQSKGRLATPDMVTRGDAAEYVRWLRMRREGLTKWWLEKDPERRLDLRLYEAVERQPGIDFEGLRRVVGAYTEEDANKLARRLGCLVKRKTLARTPTVEEWRRSQSEDAMAMPPRGVFRYQVPEVKTESGADRSSTVVARLSVLSALWNWMIYSGENAPGQMEPLLRFNIWRDALKKNRVQSRSLQDATRARKKPDVELFLQVLATTFSRTHGPMSMRAAQAMVYGQRPPEGRQGMPATFKDLRDRAALLLMVHTGVRASEMGRLKRQHVSPGDPPTIRIFGKGKKRREVGVPPGSVLAIQELSEKLRSMALNQDKWGKSDRAASLLQDSAPLIPAIAYWGKNAGTSDKGLSRVAIFQMLNRRAEEAGFERGSEEYARIHPHGIRSLFITHALEMGTPIHLVQAIAGHAQIGTTGRYAEERRPDRLIVQAFRGPQQSEEARARPTVEVVDRGAERLAVESWQPDREEIGPPPFPKNRPPREGGTDVLKQKHLEGLSQIPESKFESRERVPEIEPELSVSTQPSLVRVQPPSTRFSPKPTKLTEVVTASSMRAQVDDLARKIARWRKEPISERELALLDRCAGVPEESLRNLCVIYSIHWGEKGNRQVLVSTGGGKKSAEKRRERAFEASFLANGEEGFPGYEGGSEDQDEDLDDLLAEYGDDIEDDEDQTAPFLSGEQSFLEKFSREEDVELYSTLGTDRLNRIYCGKDSGLPWWTGTQGVLNPALPVMSARQVTECDMSQASTVCGALAKLWGEWMDESPTKAESLVLWLGEALDTAAQIEQEIRTRGGEWIASDEDWNKSSFQGKRSQPEARKVFREHEEREIVAWFRTRAKSYRTSLGEPEGRNKGSLNKEISKVDGSPAPAWFADADPILALDLDERRDLLDWILALTGRLPIDTEYRFQTPGGFYTSRAAVGEFIQVMCQFDAKIESLREIEKRQKGNDLGFKVGSLFTRAETYDQVPVNIRSEFRKLQEDARRAMSQATGSRESNFDAYGAIRDRVRGRRSGSEKRMTLSRFYLSLVKRYFGQDLASDPVIVLVSNCGKVPLAAFRDLFRVERGTITHEEDYKRAFARSFGAHSECVARRIARQLWEIRQGREKPKEAVTRPAYMVRLVEVMSSYKNPCTSAQEAELKRLRPWPQEPSEVAKRFAEVTTPTGALHEETMGGAEREFAEIQDYFGEEIERAQRRDATAYQSNPSRPMLPNPVELSFSLAFF